MRKSTALKIMIVLFLYVMTEVISEIAASLPDQNGGPFRIPIKIVLFSTYAFLIIPFIMKKQGESLPPGQYAKKIGLTHFPPLGRFLFVVFFSYLFFAVSQLCGSLLYYSTHEGNYFFDLTRHGFFESGSLIAGVFEEVVFRGVIVTLLLEKHSQLQAILISAIIFAGIHLLNLLNPGSAQSWVLSQALWAFALGIMYAYMYLKMRSILPVILLHFLINATAGIWFRGLDTQNLTSALYGIPFFGVIPAGLSIVMLWYLSSRWSTTAEG